MPEPAKPSAFRFAHPSNRFSKPKPAPRAQDGSYYPRQSTPNRAAREEEHSGTSTSKTLKFKTINRAASTPRSPEAGSTYGTEASIGTNAGGHGRLSDASKDTSPARPGIIAHERHRASSADDAAGESDEMLLDTATAISDLRPSSASRSREEERIERHDSKRRRVETGQASSSSPLAHRPRSSQASPDRLPLSAFRQPSDGTRETSTPQPQAPSFKSAPRFAPAPTSNFSPLQQSRQLNADTTPTSDPARPRFTAPAKSRLGGLTNPLPHAFSPHKNRRGQERYVSDGWASQVRGWIFDTSTQAAEADAQTAEVIQVEEVVSARGFGGQGSLAVVKGYVIAQSGSEQAAGGTAANLNKHRDILLAGEGAPTGRSTVARDRATLERPRLGFENAADVVEKGSRIRLGPPRWEMPLPQAIPKHSVNDAADSAVQDEKTTWLVCAGWKVLDV